MRPNPRQRRWRRDIKDSTAEDLRKEAERRGLRIVKYKVSMEPMGDPSVPEEADRQLQELWDLVHDAPKLAIPRLESLVEQYPAVKQVWNYLQAAVARTDDQARARQLTREIYEKFPGYLFARVNYGMLLLQEGRMDAVDALFPSGIEPQLMCPGRDEFHITEVMAVYLLAGMFFTRKGDLEPAMQRLEMMRQLRPNAEQCDVLEGEISAALWRKRMSGSKRLLRGMMPTL